MSKWSTKRHMVLALGVWVPALVLTLAAGVGHRVAPSHGPSPVTTAHFGLPTVNSTTTTTTTITPRAVTSKGNSSSSATPTPTATVAATDSNCGGQPTLVFGGITWSCTFDSEFTGNSLNLSQWQPVTTAQDGYLAGPDACYVDSPDNISVGNGYLSLTALKTSTAFTCAPNSAGAFTTQYTSGTVTTYGKFTQTYGMFEFDAKVSSSSVSGLQSSFWLFPEKSAYGPWPASGEIDVAEIYSEYPDLAIPFLHYDYAASTVNKATGTNLVTAYNCTINVGQFNTYGVEWTPSEIAIYVNSNLCMVDHWDPASPLVAPAPFNEPFDINLTQALGQGTDAFNPNTTQLPATTEVRWVRVWQGQF